MKIVLIKTSLYLLILSSLYSNDFSYENISENISYKIYNIDVNKDGIKDKIAYNKNGNELLFYIKKDNNYKKVYQGNNFSADGIYPIEEIKGYNEKNNVLYIRTVFNGAGGHTIEHFISYINKKWELNKSITTSSTYLKTKICVIKKKNEDCYYIKNLKESDVFINIIEVLRNKKNIYLFSKEYIFSLFSRYKLNLKTLTQYNNIAYYLEKAGAYKEAIYLLEKIIEKYPNRTVAYINLGDSYLKDGNKQKAIKNYKIYVKQMKEKNKDKRIPKRVLEIIDSSKNLIKIQN